MANEIEFVVVNELELKARISSIADRVALEIQRSLNQVDVQLQRHIVEDKLSGQVLHSRTGNLIRNILKITATREGNTITGGVALGANAPYGRAHEYGASIPERVPTKHKSLHWIGKSGEEVFAMRARAFVLPERSFMRSSFAEFRDRIEDAMRAAVVKGSKAK